MLEVVQCIAFQNVILVIDLRVLKLFGFTDDPVDHDLSEDGHSQDGRMSRHDE